MAQRQKYIRKEGNFAEAVKDFKEALIIALFLCFLKPFQLGLSKEYIYGMIINLKLFLLPLISERPGMRFIKSKL